MNQLIGFLADNCCVLADKDCGPECVPAEAVVSLASKRRA
jgi:hypothetical protein